MRFVLPTRLEYPRIAGMVPGCNLVLSLYQFGRGFVQGTRMPTTPFIASFQPQTMPVTRKARMELEVWKDPRLVTVRLIGFCRGARVDGGHAIERCTSVHHQHPLRLGLSRLVGRSMCS
jgi:hypothetical protein